MIITSCTENIFLIKHIFRKFSYQMSKFIIQRQKHQNRTIMSFINGLIMRYGTIHCFHPCALAHMSTSQFEMVKMFLISIRIYSNRPMIIYKHNRTSLNGISTLSLRKGKWMEMTFKIINTKFRKNTDQNIYNLCKRKKVLHIGSGHYKTHYKCVHIHTTKNEQLC